MFATLKTLAAGACVAIALSVSAPVSAGEGKRPQDLPRLKVGAQRIDITPGDLAGLNPMGGKAFASVHDPIHARIVVLEQAGVAAAFVSIDAIEVGNMDAERERLARLTGVPADHLMLTATHDHNSPRLGDVTPGALAHPGGTEVDAYTDRVMEKIAAAIRDARSAAVPATYGVGSGEANVNVNRDVFTPDGWVIGFNPEGPSDKTVHVIRFDDADGKVIAAILHYPVHANVMLGADVLSADLTGVATDFVEQELGGGAVVAFAQGALGDQAPRLFVPGPKMTEAAVDANWRLAEAQGVILGGEALRVVRAITADRSPSHIAAASEVFTCPIKQGVEQMADMHQADVDQVPIRLSMIRFGDVALGGVSGEVVNAIDRNLQARSPLRDLFVVSLTNDRVGYLPEDAAYALQTFEVRGSPVVPGCAEDGIVGGLLSMLDRLGQ